MKQQETVRVVLTGGGSGGHVTPIAEVAKSLRKQASSIHIHYIGGRFDPIARSAFKDSGLCDSYSGTLNGKFRRFVGFRGLKKLRLWKAFLFNVRDFFGFSIGLIQAFFILLLKRPAAVFSKGGSPALPVCLAAVVLRIPIVTHDSDTVPGLTHRYIGKWAKLRLFGVKPQGMKDNWRYVGVPINPKFAATVSTSVKDVVRSYKVSHPFVLVTGGGLGSRDLNFAAIKAAVKSGDTLDWLIITGKKYYQASHDLLNENEYNNKKNIQLVDFTSDMVDLMRSASIVVTRAGATALAEVSAAGAPTIIVPNPLLPGGHQSHNAAGYKDSGAALVVPDTGNAVDVDALVDAVGHMSSKDAQAKYSTAIKSFAVLDSADRVSEAILEVARA